MTDPEPLRLRHTFGSIKRKGAWTVPASVELTQRMGSTELNFTEASFESAKTTIDVDMIGGSIEMKVPQDVAVEADLATTLASYEDHRKAPKTEPRGVIVLRGRAIWGSVEVR